MSLNIPERDLERRFPRSLKNLLLEFSTAADHCACLMNDGEELVLIFKQEGEKKTEHAYRPLKADNRAHLIAFDLRDQSPIDKQGASRHDGKASRSVFVISMNGGVEQQLPEGFVHAQCRTGPGWDTRSTGCLSNAKRRRSLKKGKDSLNTADTGNLPKASDLSDILQVFEVADILTFLHEITGFFCQFCVNIIRIFSTKVFLTSIETRRISVYK